MKFGTVEIDEKVVRALRDDKLAIFAGAGVSMGTPSNLPSFEQLAIKISEGTGYKPKKPWDQLLGELQRTGISVHKIAVQYLDLHESLPNDLHHNLLSLFQSFDRVRLITTNFDSHFEDIANKLFNVSPAIYKAPALPIGNDFNGIVHVHGALDMPNKMVITDSDFGRAYLTEGWARRFLVEVFQNYTVLFVGYSYEDIVLRYLARALPTGGMPNHFALTEKPENWEILGISPIKFNLVEDNNKYLELYVCIKQLANRSSRGVLDWQNRINEICGGAPPIDDELIGEIEQALNEEYTTRFFAKVATDLAWPKWLFNRHYLDALFNDSELNERDIILSVWLAENYAVDYPYVIFDFFTIKGLQINPNFWIHIVRKLGSSTSAEIDDSALSRWITILLKSAPPRVNHMILLNLAERCSKENMVYLALKIFLFSCTHQLKVKRGFIFGEDENEEHENQFDVECELLTDQWSLDKIWVNCLKPQIDLITQPLLTGLVNSFEDMFYNLMAWGKASRNWDICRLGRSAIEPHSQDKHPKPIDVLIDATRDTLECVSKNSPLLLEFWSERLIISDVPILRRLAVYSISLHQEKSVDEKLLWLQNKIKLNSSPEHHEIFRNIELYYPFATPNTRKQIVKAILSYKLQATDDRSEEEWTARSHFDLLSWLVKVKPDCKFANEALEPIMKRYSNWRLSEQPDFTFWQSPMRWGSVSPWSVDELITMNPKEKIDDLLTYKGDFFDGPDYDGLISEIEKACKKDTKWAFSLIDALIEKEQWSTDIWPYLIRGLQEAELSKQDYERVLQKITRTELYENHLYSISKYVYSAVKDTAKPYAVDLLDDLNKIALKIWETTNAKENSEDISDWLSYAINDTAGVIVEFWIYSLSILMQNKANPERNIPENYLHWFEEIINDSTISGGLGRSMLASQTAFLYSLNSEWVSDKIIPLFNDKDDYIFTQVWQGFLTGGNLTNPSLAEKILPAFISAVARLEKNLQDCRDRFVEFYTYLAVFIDDNPIDNLIPELFKKGTLDDRIRFTAHLGYMLRQMDLKTKQQLWDRWLKQYWEKRLHGVPVPLVAEEIVEILEWLALLDDLFCAAVPLAIRMPQNKIESASFLYDLKESDLATQFQKECAELVIYLSNCVESYFKKDLSDIAERLTEIPAELRHRLDEALASIGL